MHLWTWKVLALSLKYKWKKKFILYLNKNPESIAEWAKKCQKFFFFIEAMKICPNYLLTRLYNVCWKFFENFGKEGLFVSKKNDCWSSEFELFLNRNRRQFKCDIDCKLSRISIKKSLTHNINNINVVEKWILSYMGRNSEVAVLRHHFSYENLRGFKSLLFYYFVLYLST